MILSHHSPACCVEGELGRFRDGEAKPSAGNDAARPSISRSGAQFEFLIFTAGNPPEGQQ